MEEYKKSLRIVPDSYDTKYNLAYAQKMLKADQDRQNQDQNQQDDQDQNKDRQNQDQKEDQQQDQNKEQQQPAPSQDQMSRTQAEALLHAMTQQEKKVQERKNQKKGVPVSQEKDW
ncbi:MAG: hypothetical protein KL787_00875 [Taibaiella sp.]|nr:hypothetical protein [Taibaiella sp.]